MGRDINKLFEALALLFTSMFFSLASLVIELGLCA
jgi:hypothetical protein